MSTAEMMHRLQHAELVRYAERRDEEEPMSLEDKLAESVVDGAALTQEAHDLIW